VLLVRRVARLQGAGGGAPQRTPAAQLLRVEAAAAAWALGVGVEGDGGDAPECPPVAQLLRDKAAAGWAITWTKEQGMAVGSPQCTQFPIARVQGT